MSLPSPLSRAAELGHEYLRSGSEALLGELYELAVSADPGVAAEASGVVFRGVVEPLADRFEPALCDRYIDFMSGLIERCRSLRRPAARAFDERLRRLLGGAPGDLAARARRLRAVKEFQGDRGRVKKCLVLSRVTLGADVAVTSVVLGHLRQYFPKAELLLAGGAKAAALFAAEPRLRLLEAPYSRGGDLLDRFSAWVALGEAVDKELAGLQPDEFLIVDPDSRLTQLGLLPLLPEAAPYYFFESRSYQVPGLSTLASLTDHWMCSWLRPAEGPVSPWVALADEEREVGLAVRAVAGAPLAAVNFGVGDNPAKRVADPFEIETLRMLLARGYCVVLDRGAGPEEAARSGRLLAALSADGLEIGAADSESCRAGGVIAWQGSLSGFAALIAASRVYVGYDSAGCHLAAAVGAPGVDIFHGAPCARMIERWSPAGAGRVEVVVPAESDSPEDVLGAVAGRLP